MLLYLNGTFSCRQRVLREGLRLCLSSFVGLPEPSGRTKRASAASLTLL
jgi:hypothetical protein